MTAERHAESIVITRCPRAAGIYIAAPHTWLLNEGGRSKPGQVALKRRFDPLNQLNPGKLAGDSAAMSGAGAVEA